MNKIHNIITSILGCLGLTISLQSVNEVLSIILMILSIINILLVAVSKIIQAYKKDPNNIEEMVDITLEAIDEIEDKLNENID